MLRKIDPKRARRLLDEAQAQVNSVFEKYQRLARNTVKNDITIKEEAET